MTNTTERQIVSIDASRLVSKVENNLSLLEEATFKNIRELRYSQGHVFGQISFLYTFGLLDDAERLMTRYRVIVAEIEQYL